MRFLESFTSHFQEHTVILERTSPSGFLPFVVYQLEFLCLSSFRVTSKVALSGHDTLAGG